MYFKPLLQLASSVGGHRRLSVLIFHRIYKDEDDIFPFELAARSFHKICSWLKTSCNVLTLDAAVAHLRANTLPSSATCITFDDGYADNVDVALPILKYHGLPATFFIATGFLDGGCMWNDAVSESIRLTTCSSLDTGEFGTYRLASMEQKNAAIEIIFGKIKYLPPAQRLTAAQDIARATGVTPRDDLMMTSGQVKTLRDAGMALGAHTVSHPILTTLTNEQAIAEIKGSKDFLEYLTGDAITLFAYPNGKPEVDYSTAHVELVRRLGFSAAVSTAPGVSTAASDYFQLPRFTPWDKTRLRFGLRLAANFRQIDVRKN